MDNNSKKDFKTLLRKYNVESLVHFCKNYINSPLIQIAGECDLDEYNITFHFALLSQKAISSARKQVSWDIRIDQSFPYLDFIHNGRIKYFPSGTIEKLTKRCDSRGIIKPWKTNLKPMQKT